MSFQNPSPDALKIALVVISPVTFLTLLLCAALLYRHRSYTRSPPSRWHADKEENTTATCPSCTARMIHRNALGLEGLDEYLSSPIPIDTSHSHRSFALPHFEEKSIRVRRLSAFPDLDEISRVNSVSSVLGEAADGQGGDSGRRGSVGALVVTDMGSGHVGVERRLSIDSMRQGGDPTDPHDKRFLVSRPSSSLLHYPEGPSTATPDQQVSIANDATSRAESDGPLICSPNRTPKKPKDHPDSVDLAIARSPTLVKTHLQATCPADVDRKPINPSSHPEGLFTAWAGFPPIDKVATKQETGLSGRHIEPDDVERKGKDDPSTDLRTTGSRRSRRLTFLSDVVNKDKRESADLTMGEKEILMTPIAMVNEVWDARRGSIFR